jgi:hypothetical protein
MEAIAYFSEGEQQTIKKILDQFYAEDFRAIEGLLIAEIRELNRVVKQQHKKLQKQQQIIGNLEQRDLFF